MASFRPPPPRRHLARSLLAAALALAVACPLAGCARGTPSTAAPGAPADAEATPPPETRVLADFEEPARRLRARPLLDDPRDALRLERVPAGGGRGGQALRLAHDFGGGREAAAPGDDPFERGAEVGLRLPLPDVDARRFDHLVLWLRADPEAGYGDGLKLQFRRPDPRRPGRLETASFVVTGIGPHWRRVAIPLGHMTGIRDWTQLGALVAIVQARRVGAARGAVWLDDVALVRTGRRGPTAWDPVVPPRKRAWEEAAGGRAATGPRLRERLAGWPSGPDGTVALPADDTALLWRVARDTWQGLDALRDREHGLVVDTVRLAPDSFAPERAHIGDFTHPTSLGLYAMALAAASELALLPREHALERLDALAATLERLPTWRGFLYNYYDTTTLEPTSHFVSFVDCGWLSAGLMVARSAFPERAARLTPLVERGDYGLLYDPVERSMSHGFWVHLGVPSEYHYGGLYSEARVGSLVALGKGDVPLEHWAELARGFPRLAPRGAPAGAGSPPARSARAAGVARWRGIDFVPSWGGSLFEALMPILVVDEPVRAPASLGRNARAHAAIQRRYAHEVLGLAVWGMSPAASPHTPVYAEYGVPPLGAAGYPPEAVAPYAAALALALEPQAAAANLRALAARHPVYTPFGYYDAVDPASGEVARAYLALDQGMLFLAVANRLCDGCVRRRFAEDPIARRALPLVSDAWLAR